MKLSDLLSKHGLDWECEDCHFIDTDYEAGWFSCSANDYDDCPRVNQCNFYFTFEFGGGKYSITADKTTGEIELCEPLPRDDAHLYAIHDRAKEIIDEHA